MGKSAFEMSRDPILSCASVGVVVWMEFGGESLD